MTESYQLDDELYEPFPEPGRGRRWFRLLLAGVLAAVVVAVVAGLWVARQIDPPGKPGAEVAVDIPKGSSTGRIAAILHDHGIITNTSVFKLYLKVSGSGSWQAGSYSLRKRSDMGAVVDVLDRGPKVAYDRLTIPEGYTLEQIAARVGRLPGRSAEKFLGLARGGQIRSRYEPANSTNLEGLLFPDTYVLSEKDDETRILQRMVGGFDTVADEVGLADAEQKVGLTPYQVVVVASMIEREARVPEERAKVARVIYNRLDKGMRLGIDATIRYQLNKPSGPLLKSELQRDTPYNTRTRVGLPPTPIANPGRASLEAALNPEPGPWLYYVIADADGHHAFVTTDGDFQRAKNEARKKGLL